MEKVIISNVFSLPVVMVVLLMRASAAITVTAAYIHCVWSSSHWYARFAMPAMFWASAAEVRWLLISSHDFGWFWSVTFASQALTPSFITRIFAVYLGGNCLGEPKVCWQHPWKVLGTCLTIHYKLLNISFGWPEIQYLASRENFWKDCGTFTFYLLLTHPPRLWCSQQNF